MAMNGYVLSLAVPSAISARDLTLLRHSPPAKPSEVPESLSPRAANYASSLSNAETMVSSLPPKPPMPEPEPEQQAPPVLPPPETVDTVDGPHPEQGALSLPSDSSLHRNAPSSPERPFNGLSGGDVSEDTATSFEPSAQPSAQPQTDTMTSIPSDSQGHQTGLSSFDSAPPPSFPSEPRIADTLPEPIQSLSHPPLGVNSLLNQQPTSDLRTSLSPPKPSVTEDAMDLSNKTAHLGPADDMDVNLAGAHHEPEQPMVPDLPPSDQVAPAAEPEIEPAPASEDKMDTSVEKIATPDKLPTSPPAPEPAPAALPEEQASAPVAEPVPVPPAEQPAEPTPTPLETAATDSIDHPMGEISSPPTKIAHERPEDDEVDEPAAKRARTEESTDQTEFKVPQVPSTPQTPITNGVAASSIFTDEDGTVTAPRLAHMKKIISNLKKSNASVFFRIPVDPTALNIPTYFDIVKSPMDLGTIDNKLKNGDYSSVHDFIADFEQIVSNTVIFNGTEHAVTQSAYKMQSSFNNQLANMPKANVAEPTREERRAQKVKAEPTRTAPPRRPSVSTSTAPAGSARSPSSSGPTFAVGPEGVPLIRRDSTLQDGRPKRAIIPTKRNDDLGGGRPKKKKYELQLRFCQEVLKELQSTKNWQYNQYFLEPVDPVALNIPTYFQIIKKPMDLRTVQNKLENNVYEKAKDFEEDVRLIFKNCYKFNPEGEWVNTAGHRLEEIFDKKWVQKDDWISSREPASEPQSDGEEDEDEEGEESEEDEEDDDSDEERQQKIIQLQKQIEAMSKQMGELAHSKKKKKSKSPPNAAKKSKSSKPGKKEKGSSTFPNLKQKDKDKKKTTSKSKPEKEKYVAISLAEKQYISNGISQLPDKQMTEALKIIQQNVPSLKNTHETEIELDIDEVPNHVLVKLLNFVKKYAGPPPEEMKQEPVPVYAPAPAHGGVGRPKKSKPMSKEIQEAQIEELKGRLGQYKDSSGGRGTGSPSDNGKCFAPLLDEKEVLMF